MTCRNLGGVMVCGPPPGIYHRRILWCPECNRRHRFVVRWDGAWYGTTEYGSCGDSWQEEWRRPRPFERGWRKEAQAHFRAMWVNAPSRAAYDRYVRADRDMYAPWITSKRQERKAIRRLIVARELIRREVAA